MKKAAQFISKVESGKIDTQTANAIARLLRLAEGKRVKLTLQLVKKRRSNRQNAYYWGVVIPAVLEMWRDFGETINEDGVHDYLKAYIGGLVRKVNLPDGNTAMILGSTSDLSTMDYEDYLEKCRAWAAQFNCQIPLPNEEGAYNYEQSK